MSAAERASKAWSKRTSERCDMRVNKQTDELVAHYFSLYFCFFLAYSVMEKDRGIGLIDGERQLDKERQTDTDLVSELGNKPSCYGSRTVLIVAN